MVTVFARPEGITDDQVFKFWSHGVPRGGCLLWRGRDDGRYGEIMINRVRYLVHRLAYTLHHGPIPPGLLVRHLCDTPPCIAPAHLLVGTHLDNSHDMIGRGRDRLSVGLAERAGSAACAARYAHLWGLSIGEAAREFRVPDQRVIEEWRRIWPHDDAVVDSVDSPERCVTAQEVANG